LPQEVKAIRGEIDTLNTLPDEVRPRKIKELSTRILQTPKTYIVSLSANLVNAGAEGGTRDTLQVLATTLAEALRTAPEKDPENDIYVMLAQLVRNNHLDVTLDSQRYRSEMAQLEDDDKARAKVDFTLADLNGRTWNLKNLRGSVVLVNFWYSWCKPCLREVPDLEELNWRFRDRGLVILTVIPDGAELLGPLISQGKITHLCWLTQARR
jgi:thiol-disulfide isomerase/thioredoxin